MNNKSVHVRLTPYGEGSPNSWGTKTELDGVEIREVSDIAMKFPVDGLPTLDLQIFVCTPYEVSMPADVHVHYHLPKDCILTEITRVGDDGRHYIVIKVD